MTDTDAARLIAEKTAECGGVVYFVGGCVRDRLLGYPVKDIDIEVHGVPRGTLEQILDSIGERLEYGRSFGVYGLRGLDIDIAMPRRERPDGNKHTDFIIEADPFIGTFEAARRRDFTVNALMENVLTGEITDHFGGMADMKAKVLRHVDSATFSDDPLRVLRGAQFAARFGFSIAPETINLCRNIDLSYLSGERIMLELQKALLKAERPSVFFTQLRDMSQLDVWFPELKALIGVLQRADYHQEGDVWNHTMLVVDEAAKRRDRVQRPLDFMFAALCHDFGKPMSTEIGEDGVVHSMGHEQAGIPEAERFLERIAAGTALKEYVMNMVSLHMLPNILANARSRVKKTNKMFDQSVCPEDLVQLAVCDGMGKIPQEGGTESFLTERAAVYREMMSRPYVMGRDLIEAGLEPGENFGELLAYAHKLRLAGVPKDEALRQTLSYKPS